jgi:hypothetical protein
MAIPKFFNGRSCLASARHQFVRNTRSTSTGQFLAFETACHFGPASAFCPLFVHGRMIPAEVFVVIKIAVPSFIIDGQYPIAGAQPPETLIDAFRQVVFRRETETA